MPELIGTVAHELVRVEEHRRDPGRPSRVAKYVVETGDEEGRGPSGGRPHEVEDDLAGKAEWSLTHGLGPCTRRK